MTGSCWWCSNLIADKTYYGWYDERGYYRYYNTCSCSIPYCGAWGYVRNDYCPMCHTYHPTVSISYKRSLIGTITYSAKCSVCSYYYHY